MTTKTSTGKSGSGTDKKKTRKVTQSDIRRRAEEIYKKRIQEGIPGNSNSDWIQAEKELLY
ncbi:MAG: DUF2934 domain-containing protein [Bacteroidales bacterium]|nr:DUF2934 domain-containing protein [Bacteroidales bacterium]